MSVLQKGGQGLLGLSPIFGFLQPAHPTIFKSLIREEL